MSPETHAPDRRPLTLVWGTVFGGAAIATTAGARLLADVFDYSVPCLFHAWTGAPCPTCFGLRALAALGRGEIGSAIALHPFFALGALLLAAWGLVSGSLLLLGRREIPPSLKKRGLGAARWGIPIALAANWLYLLMRR